MKLTLPSFPDAGFVGGHHVLDEDEGGGAPALLQDLQRLLDEIPQVGALLLGVIDPVPLVHYKRSQQSVCESQVTKETREKWINKSLRLMILKRLRTGNKDL